MRVHDSRHDEQDAETSRDAKREIRLKRVYELHADHPDGSEGDGNGHDEHVPILLRERVRVEITPHALFR